MNFKGLKPYLYALCTTLAFFLNIELIYKDLKNAIIPFYIGVLPLTMCFILFVKLYKDNKIKNKAKLKIAFSLLLAFFMIMGNSYLKINSWNLVFGNILMIFISIIQYTGYYLVFAVAMNKIDDFIENNVKKNKDIKINNKIKSFFDEKPFFKIFLIIIGCWLIYIVAFYPTVMSPDPATQIIQYYNLDNKYADSTTLLDDSVKLTSHHPVVHTFILGTFYELGNKMGNINFGLFIYSTIQIIVMASIYAFSIAYMKKLKTPYIIRILVLAIYCFVPMFPLYSMAAVKDTYYTGFILLFTIFIFDTLKFCQNKKLPLSRVIIVTILALLICLFRNNGIFIVGFSLPFLMLANKRNFVALTCILIATTILYTGFNKIVLTHYKITPGSIREALSIPFQQTARYVKLYGDTLTDEEKEIIDKVLVYDTLAERYDPVFADTVKDKYRKNATDEDLKKYFALWGRLLFKHPDVYVQATINNIYGYFYPHSLRWYLYYSYNPYTNNRGYEKEIHEAGLETIKFNNLSLVRNTLSGIGVAWPYIPIVGLLANVGFNTWCVLFMAVTYIILKKKEYIIALIPMLLSILICVASPVNTYFRYTMPFVFLVPFMWSIFVHAYKDKENI